MLRFAALMLLALPAFADVTVTVSEVTPGTDTGFLTVAGEEPVTITLPSGQQFDQCKLPDLSGTPQPTTPPLGPGNNDARSQSITVIPPFSCRFELDGTPMSFGGAEVEVAGQSLPLVQSGATWTITVPTEPRYPIELTWTPPTMNDDDTPLTDLAGYKLYWGTVSGMYPTSVTLSNPDATGHTVTLPQGEYFFVATAFNSLGGESARSNEAIGVASPTPGPPSDVVVLEPQDGLTVIETIVYSRTPGNNTQIAQPQGTIPIGTPCIGTEGMLAQGRVYYAVPADLVTYVGNVRPSVVYAACQ